MDFGLLVIASEGDLKLYPDRLVSIKDALMPFLGMLVLGFCFRSTVAYHTVALVKRIIPFFLSPKVNVLSTSF